MIDPTGQKLPDRTVAVDALSPRCPWCRDEISDLAIPIEALSLAHEARQLTGEGNWLYEGRPFTGAETVCPRCGRGILVKFVHQADNPISHQRSTVIAPIRSEADRRLLAERAGLF